MTAKDKMLPTPMPTAACRLVLAESSRRIEQGWFDLGALTEALVRSAYALEPLEKSGPVPLQPSLGNNILDNSEQKARYLRDVHIR
jgi:hypothetical protein